jgi:hypothetical protein
MRTFLFGLALAAFALAAHPAAAQETTDDLPTTVAQEIHDTAVEVIEYLPEVVQPTLNEVYENVQEVINESRGEDSGSDDQPWSDD